MGRINCGARSCSYNKNSACYIGTINVGGKTAENSNNTCCGSYLNEMTYSNLADYTSMRGETENINCCVGTCQHNDGGTCSLKEVEIGGSKNTIYYTETNCQSFEKIS